MGNNITWQTANEGTAATGSTILPTECSFRFVIRGGTAYSARDTLACAAVARLIPRIIKTEPTYALFFTPSRPRLAARAGFIAGLIYKGGRRGHRWRAYCALPPLACFSMAPCLWRLYKFYGPFLAPDTLAAPANGEAVPRSFRKFRMVTRGFSV